MQMVSTENVAIADRSMPIAEPSAVAWGAIIAGAVVAVVTSMVLLVLGSGLGFVAASPWTADADTTKAIGIGAIVWLVVMQLVSAALGGFVGGRLRTRWSASTDEVFFRDTAHGLLVWAVATLVTATLFTSAATSAISGAARAGAAGALATQADDPTGAPAGAGLSMRNQYHADLMLRSDQPAAGPESAQSRAELARLIGINAMQDSMSRTDSAYMAQMVATRTGLSSAEAEKRVNDVMAQARQQFAQQEQKLRAAADQARKAVAHISLWMVVSLFVGAFVAAYTGTVGGRMRDHA